MCDPKYDNNSNALQLAAYYGHTECVKLLIPVSDPKVNDSAALQWATINDHTDCVDLLFDISVAHMALQCLQDEYPDYPHTWQYLEEKITVQRQHALLMQETSQVHSTSVKHRKI